MKCEKMWARGQGKVQGNLSAILRAPGAASLPAGELVHPSWHLHRLGGPLRDLHSVSINISYRITLEFLLEDGKIIFVNVGSHAEVY
jgi:plasmid maintenance system killer protein